MHFCGIRADMSNPVMEALAAARWRELSTWMQLTDESTLAQQITAMGIPPAKIWLVAQLLIGAETGDPIPAPRSWRPDERVEFATLPRAIQAVLARREDDRDREIRRVQTAAAEARKAAEAEKIHIRELLRPHADQIIAAQQEEKVTNGSLP